MPKLLTPEEYEAEFGGGFRAEAPRAGLGTRFGASIDRAQAGLLGIGEAAGLPLGDMRRANQFESQESRGRFFRDNPDEPESFRDVDGVGSAGRFVRGLAIDSAPELTTSLATGGAGALMGLGTAGRVGLAAAANYPAAVGDILQNQRDEGGRTRLGVATALGVPYAAADLVGLDAALAGGRMARTGIRRLDDMQGFRGGLARTGANVALNAPIEGASETFQEGINQLGRISVNPNQTLFNEDANQRYLESFVGGAALGGSASAALGGWRRSAGAQPRTVDEGQFDLTGNGNPPTAPQFNLTTEMDPLQGRINQNLGLQRTPLRGYEQQFLEAFNEPSGRFVSDPATGVERELTSGELQQMELGELQAQQEATTQREQQIAQETLLETSRALGVTPVATMDNTFDVLGARVYGQPQVAKLVQEVAVLNSQLPPEQQQLNAAILGANMVSFSGRTGIPTAQKIGNAINGKIKQLQLEGVESIERAAEILNDQVATLVAAGKNEGDVKLGQIATVYERLTGQTPPALGGTTAAAPAVTAPVDQTQQPQFQRAPAPQGQTNVSRAATPAAPAAPSVDGRSPVVPGSVGNTGRDAAVDQGVGGDAGNPGAPAQQAALLPDADVQRPAAVEIDPTQYAEDEDAVEIAKLTGQGNVATAIEEEAAGQRVDREDLQDADIDAILNRRFATSEDPARDRRIFNAFLTATKYAPYGSVAKVKRAVGSDFGVEEKMVDKIGNPKELMRVGAELGFSQEQIEQAFGITVKRGGKPKADANEDTQTDEDAARAARDEAENAQEPVMGSFVDPDEDSGLSADGGGRASEKDMASGLTEAGFDGEGGFGLDDSRFWQKASSSGNKAAAPLLEIAANMDGLRQSIAELEAQGLPNAVARLREAFASQQDKLNELVKAATPTPVAPKREIGEDLAAAKKKFKDVDRDVTKMEIGELVLLRGEAERFSNKDLLAKIDAQLGDNVINVEAREVNAAPQIENAPTKVEATVATAPKKDSGQTLWDGLRKTSPDLVAYDDLTANERGYLTELADRTNGKPKLKDELGLQELMNRTTGQVLRMVRGDTVDVITPDLKFEGSITDEASLRRFPGFEAAIKHYEKNDLRHVVDGVELWMIAPDTVDFDAAILEVDGKQTLAIRAGILTNTDRLEWAMHHEIGHVADDAFRSGGVHSEAPEFNVRVSGDKLIPMGGVMREIVSFRDNNPGSDFARTMKYPLDRKAHNKLDAYEVRMETFAQLWAMFNTRDGREFMEDNLPATIEAMEIAYEAAKQDQGRAAPQADGAGAGQGAGVQANRGAQGGAATVSQIRRLNKELSVPPGVKPQVNLITRTLRTGADAALNKIIFSEDLFKRAAKMGLSAARDMDRIYRERSALTGNIEREVTRIENMYNRIPESAQGTGEKSANQFLYDSTRENKWGFTPTWRGKDASKVKVDPAIAQRYNALPKEAQAWVSAVLEHGDKMLKTKKDTLIASTNSEYDALIADAKQRGEANKVKRLEKDKADSLKQFQRLFATNEFNPYAPMRRFGDFVVIGKSKAYLDATPAERTKMESDPDQYHVSFAESRSSALELERQLTEQGSFSEVSTRAKEEARGDMYGGLMDAFNKLRGNIESELGNATEPKEIAALRAARETVAELYLQSLAENSARKSEMRRRGVAGEIDMLRSFSTQGRADAHFLASAKYNPQTQEAVVKMRQQAKQGGSQLEKSEAFKEIMARHTQSMRYEEGGWFDVAANTSRITSIWMLATNPMYYLQNLTQPFVLSLPFMTGKHNWTDASGQLMRAYFQLGDLLKSAKVGEGFDFTKVSKDKGEQDMVLKLVDRGRIDIGMDTELGQVKLEGDNIASKAATRGDQILRSLSQKVEAVNRVSTALAAYRLEIKAGRTPAQALEYADEVISQTHGDYTRINAPRLFNTPGGKVALQFRKFQLIQLTLLTKLVYNSFANSNKAEKAAARKILTFTLAHTGVLAGVVGMPGFAAVAFIANKLAPLFGDDDEPFNLENELRKMLGGGDVARMVMRGAPTLAGADLSGKLGMGNALSILPYTDFDATREGFNAIAVGLTLGATGGLGARVFQGLGDMKDGDYYRGLMGLAPIGVSQAIKAFAEANQGETNRRGDVLVSADEISTFETFAKAIGWPTSAVAERRFDRGVAFDNKEAFESKSAKLKNEYTKAVRGNDSEARRAAIEKWQRLQKSRQEAGFKPQPLSILMKAPQEQAKRERNTAGGVQFSNQNRQFVQEQTAN